MEKIFERALRKKYRFAYKGGATLEDLWDMDVVVLDEVYQKLNVEYEKSKDKKSLLKTNTENLVLKDKLEIIEHIVKVKQVEKEAKENAAVKAQQKEFLQNLLAKKQEDKFKDMSAEEIQAMLDNM